MINLSEAIDYLIKYKNYTEDQIYDMTIEEIMSDFKKILINESYE